MSKLLFVFCFIVLFLTNCTKKGSSVKYYFCGDNFKYWEYFDSHTVLNKHGNSPVCYYFDITGKCYLYSLIDKKNKKIMSYEIEDIVFSNTWDIINDTIVIHGYKYIYKSSNSDTIKLYDDYSGNITLINLHWDKKVKLTSASPSFIK